jgi:hypothetical protein
VVTAVAWSTTIKALLASFCGLAVVIIFLIFFDIASRVDLGMCRVFRGSHCTFLNRWEGEASATVMVGREAMRILGALLGEFK